MFRLYPPPILLLLAACGAGAPEVTPVDTPRIIAADQDPGNWLTHGRTYGEQRFSPLADIDTGSVARLGLAWSRELRVPRGAEATPIVVDGVMYLTSAWSIVYALDARTGREFWVHDPKVDRAVGASACCDVVNRGVAVYGDKLYLGTLDGRLIALNRANGSVAWEVVTVDQSKPYTITGAPRAANGLVYIGNGGAEYGVRGYVSAYDAESGALTWRFYTVPGNPADQPDHAASDSALAGVTATWTGAWWKLGGGGTVWDAIVYDPEFDQLIVGVGNGSPWNQQIRSPGGGDNLFLSSILALDAKTGGYKWHYQTTPGESWDYTATQPIILADLTIGGVVRKVAMQAPKNGFFYVVDRSNGKLISATPFVPMTPTAATPPGTPISWAYGVDSLTGRPLENAAARYTSGTAVVRPGPMGAHNWQPMSYSPATGLVYFPVQDNAFDFTADLPFTPREGLWNIGVVGAPLPDDPAVRAMFKATATGRLLAWDPVHRKEAWRAERNGGWNGGTLATAGGLVFQGTGEGRFLAMDAASGKQLWEFDNQAATVAGPVTYEVDGEQYVAVLGGYGSVFFLLSGFLAPTEGSIIKSRVYAYKLGGTARKPDIVLEKRSIPKPPEIPTSPAEYAQGAGLYRRYCLVCHGVAAISGGVIPDLRSTVRLSNAGAWLRGVVDGDLVPMGMPNFGNYMTKGEAEFIRQYVARQAAMAYSDRVLPAQLP